MRTNPPRRTPAPSDGQHGRPFGDDPCFNCDRPGSTCHDCGEVLCAACNKQPHLSDGHEPAQHLEEPPAPVIAELDVQPFETGVCSMCGFTRTTMRFCTGVCRRNDAGQISNVGARRGESAQPHLHHTCEQCRYEWLTQTRPPDEVIP